MADILDEVLSDTKDEKRILLFRQLLPKIIFLMFLGVIGITSYNWYKNKTKEHSQQLGDILVNVILNEVSDKDLASNSLNHIIVSNERFFPIKRIYLFKK